VINRIDTALEAEEFKHMQNMLEPLNIVSAHIAFGLEAGLNLCGFLLLGVCRIGRGQHILK